MFEWFCLGLRTRVSSSGHWYDIGTGTRGPRGLVVTISFWDSSCKDIQPQTHRVSVALNTKNWIITELLVKVFLSVSLFGYLTHGALHVTVYQNIYSPSIWNIKRQRFFWFCLFFSSSSRKQSENKQKQKMVGKQFLSLEVNQLVFKEYLEVWLKL